MSNTPDLLTELEAEAAGTRRPGITPGMLVLIMGIISVIIVIGVMFIRAQQSQPTSGYAPDFTLITYDGQPITLSELRGQIVVINFWASWCGPCREEAPVLERVWQQYRDRGVTILGVTYADDEDDARAFIAEYGLTYPIGPDIGTEISGNLYNIRGVPETFIIAPDGTVHEFIFAMVSESQLTATIDSLLMEGA